MDASTRSTAAHLLHGVASFFFVMGTLAFLFGGGIIRALSGTDRILSEMEGFFVMLLCLGLGFIAKIGQDRLEEGDSPKSLDEALRK